MEIPIPTLPLFPKLDALPHTYRGIEATDNCLVKITVTGEQGGQWFLLRTNHSWRLITEVTVQPSVEITIDPGTAWQLFTNGIDPREASKRVVFTAPKHTLSLKKH